MAVRPSYYLRPSSGVVIIPLRYRPVAPPIISIVLARAYIEMGWIHAGPIVTGNMSHLTRARVDTRGNKVGDTRGIPVKARLSDAALCIEDPVAAYSTSGPLPTFALRTLTGGFIDLRPKAFDVLRSEGR